MPETGTMELHVRLRSSKSQSYRVLLCTESRSYVYYVRAVVRSSDRFPFGTYAPGLHTPLAFGGSQFGAEDDPKFKRRMEITRQDATALAPYASYHHRAGLGERCCSIC